MIIKDEAFDEIRLQKEVRMQQKVEKERMKGLMEEYKVAMDEWKRCEEVRKTWSNIWCREWENEVAAWKELPKPKRKQPLLGKLRKAEPKSAHPMNIVVGVDEVSHLLEIFE